MRQKLGLPSRLAVAIAMVPASVRDLAPFTDDVEAISPPFNGYLSDLPPPIKRFQYHSLQQCMDAREAEWQRQRNGKDEECEWMLFTGVDAQTFKRDFLDSLEKTVWRALASYNPANQLLLTKLPETTAHSVAACEFRAAVKDAIRPMGLIREILISGGSFVLLPVGHSKAPDGKFVPRRSPPGRDRRLPSIVLEVASSEPLQKLHEDVGQWLLEAGGAVKVALTLFANRQERELVLQKWVLRARAPHREQSITMTLVDGEVRFGAESELRISFQELMLRDPLEPRETDIVITREALEIISTQTWGAQDMDDDVGY